MKKLNDAVIRESAISHCFTVPSDTWGQRSAFPRHYFWAVLFYYISPLHATLGETNFQSMKLESSAVIRFVEVCCLFFVHRCQCTANLSSKSSLHSPPLLWWRRASRRKQKEQTWRDRRSGQTSPAFSCSADVVRRLPRRLKPKQLGKVKCSTPLWLLWGLGSTSLCQDSSESFLSTCSTLP